MDTIIGITLPPFKMPRLDAYLKEAQTLKGDIARMEKALVEYPDKIAERHKTLASIDAVLALHPTPVQVDRVDAVKRRTDSMLPHGKLTQVVLRALREANGRNPVPP